MNYQAMLLGAQAAGIGVNLLAARTEKRAANAAIEAERSQLKLRAEQEDLAFIEANTASLENLAETLSTQRAILAARGTAAGFGSAYSLAEKSVRAQKADENARKLNKTFQESQMQGLNRLLNIKRAGAQAKFGATLLETGLSAFNLNTSIGQWLNNKQKTTGTKIQNSSQKNNGQKKSLLVGGING